MALPFPGRYIAAGFPWADRGCRLGQNTNSCRGKIALCKKHTKMEGFEPILQLVYIYIYMWYFIHFLLCFLAGSLKMIKTLGLIEILACGVYSTTSPSPLLYTLYTFQNDPKAVSKKSSEKSSKKPDHLACNLEHCEAGASEASWGDHWRLGWRCRLGSALAVGSTGQPLFSKTSRCHIRK